MSSIDVVVPCYNYAKYLRQVGVALSETYIQQTLAKHPAITRNLVALFYNHFDPAIGDSGLGRKGASMGIRSPISASSPPPMTLRHAVRPARRSLRR